MPNDSLPEWERVLSAAAHLQRIVPDAVLVGGTATAVYPSIACQTMLTTSCRIFASDLMQFWQIWSL